MRTSREKEIGDNMKFAFTFFVFILVFGIVCSCFGQNDPAEEITLNLWPFELTIYYPWKASPGAMLTIRFYIIAKTDEVFVNWTDIQLSLRTENSHFQYRGVDILMQRFSGGKSINKIINENETVDDETIVGMVPSDASSGAIFAEFSINYRMETGGLVTSHISLPLTYVNSLESQNLQTKYNSMKTELANTKNLMYTFLIATIVLAGATAYYARKSFKKRL